MSSPAGPIRGNWAVQPAPIQCGDVIQRGQVALEAKARDHALRHHGRHHPVTLGLAGEDIRDMDFDDRFARAAQGVGERQAAVRERAWVDDDGVACRALFFDPVDQLALVVCLQAGEREVELAGTLVEQLFEIGKRLGAVDLRLAAAECPKVGSIEYEDLHSGSTSASAASTSDESTDRPYSARPISRSRTQRGSPAR